MVGPGARWWGHSAPILTSVPRDQLSRGMEGNPNRITFSERDAAKKAARKRTQQAIESGQLTSHEAQMKAAPYSELPVRVGDLRGALAQWYGRKPTAKAVALARANDEVTRTQARAVLESLSVEETALMESALHAQRAHNLQGGQVPQ